MPLSTFENTSDEPYDRHFYLLKMKSGKCFAYEDYEQLRAAWFRQSQLGTLDTVIVVDNQQTDPPIGFG